MPIIREILTRFFDCSLCPTKGEVSGDPRYIQPNPRLPDGWSWTLRPRLFLPDTERASSTLSVDRFSENVVYCCSACTRRIEDALTPHPDKRKTP